MSLGVNGDLFWIDQEVRPEFLTGKNSWNDLMVDDLLAEDWVVVN